MGGMKIFFGPYPRADIWRHTGHMFAGRFLTNLEPCTALPAETDGGIPSSGTGVATDPEAKLGFTQKVLSYANWVLGLLGLFAFTTSMLNLTANFELCPGSKAVNNCVRNDDCTRYVQTGWFQMFMEREGYMTPEMIAEASLTGHLKLSHIGVWLKIDSLEETREAAVMIA